MRPSIIEIYKLGGYFFRLENILKSSIKKQALFPFLRFLVLNKMNKRVSQLSELAVDRKSCQTIFYFDMLPC